MSDRSLICSFLVKRWEYFQLYRNIELFSDGISRNTCKGRSVAVDNAWQWTVISFWLFCTHPLFLLLPSGVTDLRSPG